MDRCYHDGRRTLRYKAVPHIYHRMPADDDLYALFRLGGVRSRCDVASVIDLRHRPRPSARRARSLKKAQRARVEVASGAEHVDALWAILAARLADKFGTEPLHDAKSLARAQALFPDQVACVVGLIDRDVVAGVVVFHTGGVDHAQYIAADERGYRTAALDAVLSRVHRRRRAVRRALLQPRQQHDVRRAFLQREPLRLQDRIRRRHRRPRVPRSESGVRRRDGSKDA